MGNIGNLGGLELEPFVRSQSPEIQFREIQRITVETRQAIERLAREIDVLKRTSALTVQNSETIIEINNPRQILPSALPLVYPFVIAPSIHLFPDGVTLLGGTAACRLVFAEISCDPDAAAASADTTFTFQNDATTPTSTGTVTILSGTRTARTSSINVAFTAGQLFYMKSPSALNGVQNLTLINLLLDVP